MSRRTPSLLCLLLLAGAPPARPDPGPVLTADIAWQHINDKDGVTLYSRGSPGTGYREFKASGLIDAPPGAVERVLQDVPSYTLFMPYVTEARIISQAGINVLTYQRLDIPFLSNRDYTVRVQHGTLTTPAGALIYRDTWQTANEQGPAERRGVVRVKTNDGSWLLEPSGPDGGSTQATYQIFTDSGGVLPSFLANQASQIAIPKLFDAIRKQARDPKYQH